MTVTDIEVGLTEEEEALRTQTHEFARDVLRPAGIALDRLENPEDVIAPGSLLWKALDQYNALGLSSLMNDAEMEPTKKARMLAIVNEELAWGDVGLAITLGLTGLAEPWVRQTGDEGLIERFCNPEKPALGCWAIAEPNHGSDTLSLTEKSFSDPAIKADCVATKEGDEYVINGQKAAWVSNGSIADVAILFCTMDPSQGFKGGGIFVVPTDTPGITRPKPLDKLGQRSLNQGEIFFDNVRLPESHLALGSDFYAIGLQTMLSHGNSGMAQLFVGVARAAYEHALDYAKERVQGGVPIFEHQHVRSRLFKMFTKVETARAIARRVATHAAASPMPSIEHCIAAKTYVTQAAFDVASEAVQIHGGSGVAREFPVEKLFRDARSSLIEDGCNEMLSIVGGAGL